MKLINCDFSGENNSVTIELSSEEMAFIGGMAIDKVLTGAIRDKDEYNLINEICSTANSVLFTHMRATAENEFIKHRCENEEH